MALIDSTALGRKRQEVKPVALKLYEYTEANGHKRRAKLSDEDAKRLGLTDKDLANKAQLAPTATKKVTTAKNKAR